MSVITNNDEELFEQNELKEESEQVKTNTENENESKKLMEIIDLLVKQLAISSNFRKLKF